MYQLNNGYQPDISVTLDRIMFLQIARDIQASPYLAEKILKL